MMHMTFYWGKNVTLLFDFWKTNNWTSYTLTLFTCFLFSVFYHFLELRRLSLKSLSSRKPSPSSSPSVTVTTPLILSSEKTIGLWRKICGAMLFGVSSAVGYMLMLAVMSFNGGVFLSVVFGLSVGYSVFRCSDDEGEEAGVGLDSACACA